MFQLWKALTDDAESTKKPKKQKKLADFWKKAKKPKKVPSLVVRTVPKESDSISRMVNLL